jgi:hypothetical protein
VLEPKVFVASSRLSWIIADSGNRCTAISKLVKLGAIKKGRATRSGCQYTLLRAPISKLSTQLQSELANMTRLDYRYSERLPEFAELRNVPKRVKSPRVRGLPRVKREQLDESNTSIGMTWQKLAALIEKIAGLGKGALRYHPPAKEVVAFSGWLRKFKIRRSEISELCKLVKYSERPEGLALRYVFEVDTLQKRAYMDAVFVKLRPTKVPT